MVWRDRRRSRLTATRISRGLKSSALPIRCRMSRRFKGSRRFESGGGPTSCAYSSPIHSGFIPSQSTANGLIPPRAAEASWAEIPEAKTGAAQSLHQIDTLPGPRTTSARFVRVAPSSMSRINPFNSHGLRESFAVRCKWHQVCLMSIAGTERNTKPIVNCD